MDDERLVEFIEQQWINHVKKNLSNLEKVVNKADNAGIPYVRNIAAEMGLEMTPDECRDTVELIRTTIEKLRSD